MVLDGPWCHPISTSVMFSPSADVEPAQLREQSFHPLTFIFHWIRFELQTRCPSPLVSVFSCKITFTCASCGVEGDGYTHKPKLHLYGALLAPFCYPKALFICLSFAHEHTHSYTSGRVHPMEVNLHKRNHWKKLCFSFSPPFFPVWKDLGRLLVLQLSNHHRTEAILWFFLSVM